MSLKSFYMANSYVSDGDRSFFFETFNISVYVYYWVDKEIDNRKNRLADVRLG